LQNFIQQYRLKYTYPHPVNLQQAWNQLQQQHLLQQLLQQQQQGAAQQPLQQHQLQQAMQQQSLQPQAGAQQAVHQQQLQQQAAAQQPLQQAMQQQMPLQQPAQQPLQVLQQALQQQNMQHQTLQQQNMQQQTLQQVLQQQLFSQQLAGMAQPQQPLPYYGSGQLEDKAVGGLVNPAYGQPGEQHLTSPGFQDGGQNLAILQQLIAMENLVKERTKSDPPAPVLPAPLPVRDEVAPLKIQPLEHVCEQDPSASLRRTQSFKDRKPLCTNTPSTGTPVDSPTLQRKTQVGVGQVAMPPHHYYNTWHAHQPPPQLPPGVLGHQNVSNQLSTSSVQLPGNWQSAQGAASQPQQASANALASQILQAQLAAQLMGAGANINPQAQMHPQANMQGQMPQGLGSMAGTLQGQMAQQQGVVPGQQTQTIPKQS
jgi:hypothetical protein